MLQEIKKRYTLRTLKHLRVFFGVGVLSRFPRPFLRTVL